MENFIEINNLQPGDRIVTPLLQTGLSKHHIIYMGNDNAGMPLFAENRIFKGVRIATANELSQTVKIIDRIIRFEGSVGQRQQAVQRAYSLVGKEYNLIAYNCEHFANEVQTGIAYSSQVGNTLVLFFGLMLIRYAARSQ